MRHVFPSLAALFLSFVCAGCVKALNVSEPTAVQMRVANPQPQQYAVRVTRGEPADYPISTDGVVLFFVPGHRSCSTYLCGMKVADGTTDGERVVQLLYGERVIRTLSLRQIAKLPTDASGYSIVKIED